MLRRVSSQAGQTAAEYLGVLLLVGMIIAALASMSLAGRIAGEVERIVCSIAGGTCDGGLPPTTPPPTEDDIDDAVDDLEDFLEDDPSPQEIADYFEELDPRVAQELARRRPELIGPRDGVPFELRYAANHELILREIARRESEGDDIPDDLRHMADPERQFLLFNYTNDGRIIEVHGDLGAAEHIGVFVPGTGEDKKTWDRVSRSGRHIYEAMDEATDEPVAAISWLNYNPPDGVPQAMTTGPADDGAEALGPLPGVIDPDDDAHVTVVGHSYGGTTAGHSLKDDDLDVDDAVFVAAPGTGVDDADDLDTDAELWATRENLTEDPVGAAPVHGEDPFDVGFGANRFHSGRNGGHSHYFDEGTEALQNIAYIATDQDHRVNLDD